VLGAGQLAGLCALGPAWLMASPLITVSTSLLPEESISGGGGVMPPALEEVCQLGTAKGSSW